MSDLVSGTIESISSLPSGERKKVLRELLKLCYADGELQGPMLVTNDDDLFSGYVFAMFPRTQTPLPDLTEEERAELQRRYDNRHQAVSEAEFIARVRALARERSETARS